MPELPDVEVFRRYVDATSIHQKIKSVAVRNEKVLGGVSARKLQRALNFRERLEGTRGGVRATLMNQKNLASIGNVYSDEILFLARLHPETGVAHLDGSSPRIAPQRDTAGAGDGDRTRSRSAQVIGAPSCSLTGTRARGARGAMARSGRAKPQDELTTALPTEGEVTRKWPGKQNGRSSKNALSRSSARSRFSGKVLSTPGSLSWEKRQVSMRSKRGVRS